MKLQISRSIARRAAFTLIELLVVIAIIAILAGMAMPAMQSAMLAGKQSKALSDARQVAIALRMFAGDNDGQYPSQASDPNAGVTTSNDAFKLLIPSYLETESIFVVAGSKAGASADNKMDTPAQTLAMGENHWAYISGLSTSSSANWPLVVDHTDGSGFYSNREGDLGGTWKGSKAVVIRTDASGSVQKLSGTGNKRFIPRFDDKQKNALQVRDYMGEEIKLLEPAS